MQVVIQFDGVSSINRGSSVNGFSLMTFMLLMVNERESFMKFMLLPSKEAKDSHLHWPQNYRRLQYSHAAALLIFEDGYCRQRVWEREELKKHLQTIHMLYYVNCI